jgi:hypothetical protein
MRKTVRLHATTGPEERLAAAIATLPGPAQRALVQIADREDLPLVAGSWEDDGGGCLVANVVRALDADWTRRPGDAARTFDLRVLDLLPELSSRDLNLLIVAWDEAAAQEGRDGDPALRRLLRGALARAGVAPTPEAPDVQAQSLVRTPPSVASTV